MKVPNSLARPKNCRTAKCTGTAFANGRGLCMRCYSKAKKLVEDGQFTWKKLEDLGMVDEPKDAFTEALEAKLRGTLPEGP